MLVRAVLAPHRAEHRPLERVRLAADLFAHEGSLVLGEACVLWDLVRLRRFRRPQGWGRTHDRVIAPCDAIRGKSSAKTGTIVNLRDWVATGSPRSNEASGWSGKS